MGLKVLLHYSIKVSHKSQCDLWLIFFFAKSTAFTSEKNLFEQFFETAKHRLVPYVEMCRKIGPYEGTISKDNFYQSW
jgi:hypothetical protein